MSDNVNDTETACHFCGAEESNIFWVCTSIRCFDDKEGYEIGIIPFKELVNKWLLERVYHLSVTEILLFRPDLVNEFLQYYKPDYKFTDWTINMENLCLACHEKYKKEFPAR